MCISSLQKLVARLRRDENGSSLVEYSILLGLMAVAAITAVTAISGWIITKWQTLQTALGV